MKLVIKKLHLIQLSDYIFFFSFNEASRMILQRDLREEIHKVFQLFDDDDSGKISLKKLRRIAR